MHTIGLPIEFIPMQDKMGFSRKNSWKCASLVLIERRHRLLCANISGIGFGSNRICDYFQLVAHKAIPYIVHNNFMHGILHLWIFFGVKFDKGKSRSK